MHGVIQKAMGWKHSHANCFRQDGRVFAHPDPEGDYVEDDSRFSLGYVLIQPGDMVAYEYDFGDSWAHTLLLEQIVSSDAALGVRCIAGAHACLPRTAAAYRATRTFWRPSSTPSMSGTAS